MLWVLWEVAQTFRDFIYSFYKFRASIEMIFLRIIQGNFFYALNIKKYLITKHKRKTAEKKKMNVLFLLGRQIILIK